MKQHLSMIVIAGTLAIITFSSCTKEGPASAPLYFTVQLFSPLFKHLRISSLLPAMGLTMDQKFTFTPLKTFLLQSMQVVHGNSLSAGKR